MSNLRLNLASGQRPFGEGWTNCDRQQRWNPDVLCDMTSMPMFSDGSADMIVIHHGAEHLHLEELDACLKECHRILAPRGSLLLFLPDIRALCHAWIEQKISDYIFCVNMWGAYQGDPNDDHHWGWHMKSMAEKLGATAKWNAIYPFDWRPIPNTDLARDWWLFAIEAIK